MTSTASEGSPKSATSLFNVTLEPAPPYKRAEADLENHQLGYTAKVKQICHLAAPIVASVMVANLMTLVTLSFAGRVLGPDFLAYATIANSLFMVTGFYVGYGLSCSLDMLCTQEYGRNPESPLMKVYLVRSLLTACVSVIPLSLLWLSAPTWLQVLVDAESALPVAEFLRVAPLLYVPLACTSAISKFLQAKHHTVPVAIASAAALVVCIPSNTYFVPRYQMYGLAFAQLVASCTQAGVLIGAVWLSERSHGGFSLTILSQAMKMDELLPFIKISLSSLFASFIEGTSFEMTVLTPLICGLSTQEIAANGLLTALLYFTFPCQFGLSAASSVLVGNAIGAEHALSAHQNVVTCVGMAFGLALLDSTILFLFHEKMFLPFTDDVALMALASKHVYAVIGCHQMDLVQYVFQGVCRGFGHFHLTTFVTVLGQWMVAAPLGLFLTYYAHHSISGAFEGFMIGASMEIIVFIWKLSPYLKSLTEPGPVELAPPTFSSTPAAVDSE
jgi:MATE family multidrug resistance protein